MEKYIKVTGITIICVGCKEQVGKGSLFFYGQDQNLMELRGGGQFAEDNPLVGARDHHGYWKERKQGGKHSQFDIIFPNREAIRTRVSTEQVKIYPDFEDAPETKRLLIRQFEKVTN